MPSVSLFCNSNDCGYYLGDTLVYQFYEKFTKWYQIIVKLDMRELFLTKFASLDNQSSILCRKCKSIIGKEKRIGPKKEQLLCLLKEKILCARLTPDCYEKKIYGQSSTWNEFVRENPEFTLCNNSNFYPDETKSIDLATRGAVNPKNDTSSKALNLIKNYKYSCRYTLQAYLCDKNSNNDGLTIINFLKVVETLDGFKQADPCTNDTYLSNEIENCVIYNLDFEKFYNDEKADAEEEFACKSIQSLLDKNIENQALIWLKKKDYRSAYESPANVHLMCNNVEFGNLKSPFRFIKSQTFKDVAKFSVLFEYRCICILLFHENVLYKFEIDFSTLESFICINENQDSFNVYIPCKRPVAVFRSKKTFIDNSSGGFEYGLTYLGLGLLEDYFEEKTDSKNYLENLDEEKMDWENYLFENQDWTLNLQFKINYKSRVVRALESIFFNRILFCKVKNFKTKYTLEDLRSAFKSRDFETKYYIECLISQYYSVLNGKINEKFTQLLLNSTFEEIRYIVKNLCLKLRSNRFVSIDKLVEMILKEMYEYGETDLAQMNELRNYKIQNIKHAIITPSRVIYYFPEPNVTNRVLRKFKHENFLCVRIRNDDLQKLNRSQNYTDMKEIYEEIYKKLCAGIPFYKYKWHFLAMSSSQMRDHGCWLYATENQIEVFKIREWMGNFKNIRCIGKYAARLGQSLSCSIETIETNNFKIIKDYKRGDYCFTDGIGQISKAKAEEICKKYFNSTYISVFQIRFAGFKGVVSINPYINDELIFRPSMNKFESANNRLDVLNKAEFIPCNLNRQVIIILTALGIKDEVFSYFQDLMLQQLSRILVDNQVAKGYLAKYFKNHYSFGMVDMRVNYSFEYTSEPFFRELLKLIYNCQLSDLINKSRILIEKGRILMGVIDEYGLLQEDEVFIQCSTETVLTNNNFKFYEEIIESKRKGFFIVKSKVAVAKNPCMHPGDLRVLKAVYVKELEHLTNCIVFPRTGYRPITNMCSGSDLDGDLYFVTWEPLLIPKTLHEPMEYASSESKNKDSDVVIEDVIRFFISFIETDQLGRIANAHVAISDCSAQGVSDQRCIELAAAFSKAVDFPKTGEVAEMPNDAKKIESYPDFMERDYNKSYVSQKIIGKMYRKCKRIASHINFVDKVECNPCFQLPGHEEYLIDARKAYEKYRYEMEHLMAQYECKTESELLIGVFFHLNKNSDAGSKNDFKLSMHMVKNLWIYFRKIFFEEFEIDHENYSELPKKVLLKASAWYIACYTHHGNRSLRILSFPWIIEDILTRFKFKSYSLLSKSILLKYTEFKKQLIGQYNEKINLKSYLEDVLNLRLFMMSAIDLFVYKENNMSQFQIIKPKPFYDYRKLKQILDEDNFYNVDISSHHLTCKHDFLTTFRITNSTNYDLSRYLYIRKAVFSNRFLLPILHVIVHFAHLDKVFTFLSSQKINLNLFLIFCIQYFEKKKLIEIDANMNYAEVITQNQKDFDKYDDWSNLFNSINVDLMNHVEIGDILLNFYYDLAFEKEFKFNCPFELIEFRLREDANNDLKTHFSNSLNFISKVNDISLIWDIVFCENIEEPKKNVRRRRQRRKNNFRRRF